LWSSSARLRRESLPPTRLTQRCKREAKGALSLPPPINPPKRETLCEGCGKTIGEGHRNCATCTVGESTKNMLKAARICRETAHSSEARLKRASTQRRNA